MEKIERPSDVIRDAIFPIQPYELHFISDEKDLLRLELGNFKQEPVEGFINNLEVLCRIMDNLANVPKKSDFLNDIKPMLNSFNKTVDYLKKLEQGKRWLPFPESPEWNHFHSDKGFHSSMMVLWASDKAKQASEILNQIISLIGDLKKEVEQHKSPRQPNVAKSQNH